MVNTDGEVTTNRQDIKIRNKKRENMHNDRCGNISGEECHAKEAEKKRKYKSLRKEIQQMWNLQP
jgi:hypothetical protein